VPGLRTWRVEGPDDVQPALELIAENRHMAATALNERSSRSHCVLSLTLALNPPTGEAKHGDEVDSTSAPVFGVLHIVDLAGSERTKTSQAEGQQMKEANCINKSLSSLADVLYALGEGSTVHVPYRNSKLTYLLQEALGGRGCKTLLFAQVSPDPADVHESYSTLTFAARVATNVQKGRLRPPSAHGLLPSSSAASLGGSRRSESGGPTLRGSRVARGSPASLETPPRSRLAAHCSLDASDATVDTSLLSPVPPWNGHGAISGGTLTTRTTTTVSSSLRSSDTRIAVTPERWKQFATIH